MISIRATRRSVLAVLTLASCFGADIDPGGLRCRRDSSAPCPSGMTCLGPAGAARCYPQGTALDASEAAPPDGGGDSGWQRVTLPETSDFLPLHAVWLTDANTGWIAPSYGDFLHTTDGGESWTSQPSGDGLREYLDLQIVDGARGYAVGRTQTWSAVLRTDDGGAHWTPQDGETAATLRAVCFPAGPEIGWAVGADGTVLKTTGGGALWVAQDSKTTATLKDVHFPVDASTGYCVGDDGTILKTEDGGATWFAQRSGTTVDLNAVQFPADAQVGYAVGSRGTILKTEDGGATWRALSSGVASTLEAVHFPAGGGVGFATGRDGVILRTDDGESWRAQDSGTTVRLEGVHFSDERIGFAVGDEGVVLKTTSGGE